MPPKEPPVAAKPVAAPRRREKKWAMAPTAGVKISEVPTPPRMENVRMKCQYSVQRYQQSRAVACGWKSLFRERRTGTLAHSNHTDYQADGSCKYQPSWSIAVKDGPNLQTASKSEEDVEAEDPSYRAWRCICQLVGDEVGLEGTNGLGVPAVSSALPGLGVQKLTDVHLPKGCQHAAKGSKHDQPCL